MGTRWLERGSTAAVLLAGFAFGMHPGMLSGQTDRTAPAVKPSIEILAPAGGASVPPGKVLVIGRVRGKTISAVEIDVNGKVHQRAATSGGGFMATVYMTRGRNVLTVHANGASVEKAVAAADTVTYRYHPQAEKCAGCHSDAARGYVVSGRKDAVCYQCHDRMDGRKLIHGPLGGGDCTSCHDPHGALNPALTVAGVEALCVMCHDQSSSARHMKDSGRVGCVTCHDPHASNKAFLQK